MIIRLNKVHELFSRIKYLLLNSFHTALFPNKRANKGVEPLYPWNVFITFYFPKIGNFNVFFQIYFLKSGQKYIKKECSDTLYTFKTPFQVGKPLFFGRGRWIRTTEVTESESVALPLGDTPIQFATVLYQIEKIFTSIF